MVYPYSIQGVIESGGGEVIDQLPTDSTDHVCVLYKDEAAYKEDKANAANSDLIKLYLDPFFDCILKQNFDVEHQRI